MHIGAESDRQTLHHYFKDSANGVPRLARLINASDHARLRDRIRAAQRALLRLFARPRARLWVHGHTADLRGERPDLHAERAEQRLRHTPRGNARRGLARRCALEHIANIIKAVLECAGEIRVSWANAGDGDCALRPFCSTCGKLGRIFGAQWLHLHHARPVLPVAILNQQQDGGAERESVSDAAANARVVLFNLLTRSATVAALSALQVNGDRHFGERNSSGHPLDDDAEFRPV